MSRTLRKTRILPVTRNFPPLTGGMERLMQKAAEGMAEWADLTIVGPIGCGVHAPANATIHEVPHSMAPFMLRATQAAFKACRAETFDIVLGGSGLVAPILGLLQKFNGLRTAIFIHGLDIVIDNTVEPFAGT